MEGTFQPEASEVELGVEFGIEFEDLSLSGSLSVAATERQVCHRLGHPREDPGVNLGRRT